MSVFFLLVVGIVLPVDGEKIPYLNGYTPNNVFSPDDPCLPTNHKEIDQWERSVKNTKLHDNGSICDSFLKPGWYRPISKAGNSMPNQCLHEGCGTVRPIWIKGNLPKTGQITNATACASTYKDCCVLSYDIQVKNCTTFNIYNLVSTYGCAQAYCFGKELPCPIGYSSDTGFSPGCTRTLTAVSASPRATEILKPATTQVTSTDERNRIQKMAKDIASAGIQQWDWGKKLVERVSPGAAEIREPESSLEVPASSTIGVDKQFRIPTPLESVLPGVTETREQGLLHVVPESAVGETEHLKNNDGIWVYIIGVLCLMEFSALVVYVMVRHIRKRKTLMAKGIHPNNLIKKPEGTFITKELNV